MTGGGESGRKMVGRRDGVGWLCGGRGRPGEWRGRNATRGSLNLTGTLDQVEYPDGRTAIYPFCTA